MGRSTTGPPWSVGRIRFNYSSTVTLHGGPVVLRPVRATPCFKCRRRRRRSRLGFLLLFICCTSWLLRTLSVNTHLLLIQYLTAASDLLQGLLFPLVYCLLDDKVTLFIYLLCIKYTSDAWYDNTSTYGINRTFPSSVKSFIRLTD